MTKRKYDTVEDCVRNFNENRGHPIKILFSFYKGEAWTLIKSAFFLLLQHSPTWVVPILTAAIIDIITYPERGGTITDIILYSIIALIFISQNAVTTYTVMRIYGRLTRRIEYSLRSSIIDKLQHLSIMYHKNVSSGKLQSKIMRDCEHVELLLAQLFRNSIVIVANLAVAISVTMSKSPIVILFFIILVPIEILLLKFFRNKIKQRNTTFRKEIERTQSNVSEMIELIPVARAHGLQKKEAEKMDAMLENVMSAGYNLDKTNTFFSSCTWVLMEAAKLTCLSFTAYLAFKGKITVGDVVLYQTYFGQIVNAINSVLNIYPQLSKGMESINSIGEILYEENVETDNAIVPLDNMQGAVEFRDIFYKYEDGDRWILNNFNLSVKPGESIAFVGGSGAGKSTILNLLIGFDRPQDGKILIDRINMLNLDMTQYRNQIAVVPQATILFSGTVRDNITYGLDNVSDEEVYKVIMSVGLEDLIDEMPNGIHTQLGEHGGKLSGGQRQRISIARALLRKPKIIIFDEATSALDSASEKKVQAAVDNMMKQCTTFLVAHRLSTIKNADRIAVISQGKISEIGTYDQLMELKGDFYTLKKMQE